jgi:peptidoglycan/LPS O-acetylase OafA/YrhL
VLVTIALEGVAITALGALSLLLLLVGFWQPRRRHIRWAWSLGITGLLVTVAATLANNASPNNAVAVAGVYIGVAMFLGAFIVAFRLPGRDTCAECGYPAQSHIDGRCPTNTT